MEDPEFTFTARVQELNRVTIPRVVSEELEIAKGSVVEVKVKRIRS